MKKEPGRPNWTTTTTVPGKGSEREADGSHKN